MKIKSLAAVICMSVGLALAGCSSTKGPGGVPVTNGTDNGGASTSGIGNQTGFNGMGASCAQAPADQSYYFDLNSDSVKSQDTPCINAQAKYLIAHPNAKVRLEGNCDNRGSREYNRGLGWRRANSVKSVLLQDGVSPNQITTFSWGSEKASPGTGDAVWSHDRRVDIIFKNY